MAEKNSRSDAGAAEVPHYHGHRQRLRERFREAGGNAVADYDLCQFSQDFAS
jgi:DNA repair protein RadC